MLEQALTAIEDLQAAQMELESLKLDSRQNVTKIRQLWASSRKTLTQANTAIQKAGPDKKHPDREQRADSPQDGMAINALSSQIFATSQDLAQAPRTQEGFAAVEETALGVFEQFETINPPEAVGEMKTAKEQFKEGVAVLAPLALGKEEALKQAAGLLTEMANKLAALVGDEAPAPEEKDNEPDPSAQPDHADPAPSPHPLPPPPPPPKADKAPAGAAAP